VLIRPHFGPAVLIAVAVAWLRLDWRDRRFLVLPGAVVLTAGAALLITAAGGPEPLWSGLRQHLSYHLELLPKATHSLSESGLARGLGGPAVAAVWALLAVVGLATILRRRLRSELVALVLGALLPIVATIQLLSNPSHARYAVPVLALTSGLVVIGGVRIFGRANPVVVAIAVLGAAILIVPQLRAYRSQVSPPLRAIRVAVGAAHDRGGVLVADRTLISFVDYERASGRAMPDIVWDHVFEMGAIAPPPSSSTVAIFDAGHDHLLLGAEEMRVFSCEIPILRRLAQDRFTDLSVAVGAELARPSWQTEPATSVSDG
jgi:hypothetical protein